MNDLQSVQEQFLPQVEEFKKTAKDSLFYFIRSVIGNKFIVPHVHKELGDWLQSADRRRKRRINGIDVSGKLCLIMLPRDSLKTTFISVGYPLWLLINNSDSRILIDSESRDLSKTILKNIKNIIDSCSVLRNLWGDLNGAAQGNTWNLEAIRVITRKDFRAKEDSVETSGIDVAVTGRHYGTIIMDDLHSERNITSKDQIEKVKDHIQYMMPLMESDGELIIIGTRWGDDDAYEWVMSLKDDNGSPLFDTFIRSCYKEDKTAYYPERNSLATLALKKATLSDSKFSSQYLLDPMPEDIAPLKKSYLQFLDTEQIPQGLSKFMMCDTIGDKKDEKGDYFAATIWGIDMALNELGLCKLYLLDGDCGWFDIDKQIQSIVNLYVKTRPNECGIEKSGMNTLTLHLSNNLKAKGLYMMTTVLQPSGRGKEQRIMQFLPYAQNNMVFVNKACNEKFLEEFIYEWSRFPKAKRDDCLKEDALIKTNAGYKYISEIKEGDYVYTHKQRYCKVKKVIKKPYRGLFYNFKGSGQLPLELSEGHKLYYVARDYSGYKEGYKNIGTYNRYGWIEAKDWKATFKNIVPIEKLADNKIDIYKIKKHKMASNLKNDTVILDKNFALILGYFIAEGHVHRSVKWKHKHAISFASHVKECDKRDILKKYLKKYNIFYKERIMGNGVALYFSSKIFADLFSQCYDIDGEKIIPEYAYQLGKDLKYVLDGWIMGDGWKEKKRNIYDQLCGTTSRKLIIAMRDIAISRGWYAVIRQQERYRYEKPTKDFYTLFIKYRPAYKHCVFAKTENKLRINNHLRKINNNEYASSLKKSEPYLYDGFVYDLQVEDDYSFIANGFVIHNCCDSSAYIFDFLAKYPPALYGKKNNYLEMANKHYEPYDMVAGY